MDELRWQLALREAMGTADFPNVFGDSLERSMRARYQSVGRNLDPIFERVPIRDFRSAKQFRIDGTVKRLQIVGERGTYGEAARYETEYSLALAKYGKIFDLSWEAFVNDDLGIFNSLAIDLADSAINTEAWKQTSTFWDASGPLDSFFAGATGQGAVASTALTIDALQTACAAMQGNASGFRNRDGEPLLNRPGFLVVGPALRYTAQQILQSTEVERLETQAGNSDTAKTYTQYGTKNIGSALGLTLIVDPWIPVVVTSGTIASTTWAIFSRDIKAAAIGRLRGRETPEIFMHAPDQMRAGGGMASVWDGDFDADAIKWKVRHCLATTATDLRAGWASDGQ
jgi:hypothetical protein